MVESALICLSWLSQDSQRDPGLILRAVELDCHAGYSTLRPDASHVMYPKASQGREGQGGPLLAVGIPRLVELVETGRCSERLTEETSKEVGQGMLCETLMSTFVRRRCFRELSHAAEDPDDTSPASVEL